MKQEIKQITDIYLHDMKMALATIMGTVGIFLQNLSTHVLAVLNIKLVDEIDAIVDASTHLVGLLIAVLAAIYGYHRTIEMAARRKLTEQELKAKTNEKTV